ncbi:MAG: hypothetical protein IJ538_00090 [Clostridia bacterium]|nr:hypothetical protein [Clostridia bacterium]
MKKLIKGIISFALVMICAVSLVACGKSVSAVTVDTSKVETSNGVTTNGGITTIYDGYLYFINGTVSNDGTNSTGNTVGAIARVKLEDGKPNEETYEIVVDDLVGFDNGSLYFFGDYMYFTTPGTEINYLGKVLYYKTKFMRYDLVNKRKDTLFTTSQNSESESISYQYYVIGEHLYLVVYEKTAQTITSLKLDSNVSTNYVLTDVQTSLLSEKTVQDAAVKNADSYVYYTLSHQTYDANQNGNVVYRTGIIENKPEKIADNGLTISLLSIRNGKLIYSASDKIYATAMTGASGETLKTNIENTISYISYENVAFLEASDGNIIILSYDKSTGFVSLWKWINGTELEENPINKIGTYEKFNLITLTTLSETVDEENNVVDSVKYLIYIADSVAYKLEIERTHDGATTVSTHSQPVKLSTSTVNEPTGLIVPEVVGNNLYFLVKELDSSAKETGNVYVYTADITISEDSTKEATFFGMKKPE